MAGTTSWRSSRKRVEALPSGSKISSRVTSAKERPLARATTSASSVKPVLQ